MTFLLDFPSVAKGIFPFCCVLVPQVVQSFRLTLQVADMSGMGLTSTGRAILHITDINNHAPQFNPNTVSTLHVHTHTHTPTLSNPFSQRYEYASVFAVHNACHGE